MVVQPIQVDDDIYMRSRIYNPLFSYNTDIPVGQVFLEMRVPSDYCWKDQRKKVEFDTLQYRWVLPDTSVLSRKAALNQWWAENLERVLGLWVPAPGG